MKTKIQLIEKQIDKELQEVRIIEELDSQYSLLTGIAFLDNISTNSLITSSSVNGSELFPRDFEVAFLQSNQNVAPNDRFFTLKGIPADGHDLSLDFKDGAGSRKYPYTLRIYLRLENTEQ